MIETPGPQQALLNLGPLYLYVLLSVPDPEISVMIPQLRM